MDSTKLAYKNSIYQVNKKKKKKVNKFKKRKMSRIERYSHKLNTNLPNSERWFQSLFKEHEVFKKYLFFFNKPLGCYIPDVICFNPRIIIEIDGSIHNTESQKFRDAQKDLYYKERGYTVYRIKAYDVNEFNNLITYLT